MGSGFTNDTLGPTLEQFPDRGWCKGAASACAESMHQVNFNVCCSLLPWLLKMRRPRCTPLPFQQRNTAAGHCVPDQRGMKRFSAPCQQLLALRYQNHLLRINVNSGIQFAPEDIWKIACVPTSVPENLMKN
jgi:hypothetical protein